MNRRRVRETFPQSVLEASVEFHNVLLESKFYEDECGVHVNNFDCIEFIAKNLMLPKYVKSEPFSDIADGELEDFLKTMTSFAIKESLVNKGILAVYQDEDTDDIYYMTKLGKLVSKDKFAA
jgi:hypothetical protein